MGWSSGTELASKIEDAFKPYMDRFTPEEISNVGRIIAEAFADMDADSLGECDGFIGDADSCLGMEADGAPRNPPIGTEFGHYGDKMRFDGKRWRYVGDD